MNMKLFAALACGAALTLSACFEDTPASSKTPVDDPAEVDAAQVDTAADPVGETQTPAEEYDEAEEDALDGLAEARRTVLAAVARAAEAVSDEARATMRTEIERARKALDDAVKAARALTAAAPSGDETRRAGALRVAGRADDDLAELTKALDGALSSLAWYRQSLARYQIPRNTAAASSNRINTVTINRIERTITVDGNVRASSKAFKRSTFKDVMYADGKEVFLLGDGGGDEFKVDGWVGWRDSDWYLEEFTYTGLKLTNTGLVIRTGGTTSSGRDDAEFRSDFTDMRRNITNWANDPDGDGDPETPFGQNGWDLELTFNEPHITVIPVGAAGNNFQSSRTGNGDFYWNSFVPADPRQFETNGEYYAANAFNQPDDGRQSLGTYEIWLSNHIGVDKNSEPVVPGTTVTCPDLSRGTSCPDDDEQHYLDYAAYGLFVYTADTTTPLSGNAIDGYYNGRAGRINTLHFGYSAFREASGQRTVNIGEAITSGKFYGQTLAYETQGSREDGINSKLLRGDVTLTVTIPRGTGPGTLEGTLSNFQSWYDGGLYWTDYADSFTVVLNSVTVNYDGTFVGSTQATPSAGLNAGGSGLYKGSFYGPRTDSSDLEIAGSWTVGALFGDGYSNDDLVYSGGLYSSRKSLYGSFGAKQRPDSAGN